MEVPDGYHGVILKEIRTNPMNSDPNQVKNNAKQSNCEWRSNIAAIYFCVSYQNFLGLKLFFILRVLLQN